MATYISAPAVGVIDDSNNLTLKWIPDGSQGYTDYDHWNITVNATIYRFPSSGSVVDPTTTQVFTQVLSGGSHSMTMQAFDSSNVAVTLPWQTNGANAQRNFPAVLSSSSVLLNKTSVLKGETLTVTLDSLYTDADQWQIIWPDQTTTGWLPLNNNVVAKSFQTAGAQTIVVQTKKDYSGAQYNPPATLLRQTSKQIFVVDQQASGTSTTTGGLTGDLGIGGQQGFEITDASSPTVTPNAWEVIARAFVRDMVTNELKLLVATTRFSNASSLLGTMAIDVFPIEGRPHSKELVTPPYELTTTTSTESTPVKIQTSVIPDLIVGKTITQALGGTFQMATKPNTGLGPFLWTATGLPAGVQMSSSGVITGTPLELGTFTTTFAVQDSSIPFSIDEVTLTINVKTDLLVIIANGQTDANNTTLAPLGTTLGVGKVGTVYKVQMAVGNTNVNSSLPGGLPPYTWSIPAGALPVGLAIDPNTGIISGTPCTYNSTTDFQTTYTAIVQVTDAIGAKATQTYTMTLIAANMQFSTVDQPNIYPTQDFKLAVGIFGGQSPYSNLSFNPPISEASYYTVAPSSIVDGQIEIVANVPTAGSGTRSFTLSANDSGSHSVTPLVSTQSYVVGNQISDIRLIDAFVDHYWASGDTAAATPIAITGDFSGYTLGGTTLALTSVANASGGSTVYTGTIGSNSYVGQTFTVKGFANSANNGVFACTANDATTLTLSNPNGVAETHAGSAVLDVAPGPSNGIGVAVDATVPEVDFQGPASTFRNSRLRVPLGLSQASNPVATISREYTLLSHDDSANPGDVGSITTYARPYIADVDLVCLNPRKPYYNSPAVVPASLSGANLTARVQTGSSLPPGLSLDANTGLIYGTLKGVATNDSFIEYIDNGGAVHGTVQIVWTTLKGDFLPNGSFADHYQLGVALNTAIISAVGFTLSAPTIVAGSLPAGLSLSVDNTGDNVLLVGTPTEAGYFDLWFRVTGNGNQVGYLYSRLAIDYTKPLVILNSSLPSISNQPYKNSDGTSVVLQGYGGIPPYTWSSPQFPGGTGTGAFAGLTLTNNSDNTATLSGTLTTPPGTSPTDLGNITFNLSDSSFPTAITVSKDLDLVYDNRLRIITPTVPTIIPSTDYGFAMQAAGGVPPYYWQIDNSPVLPTGITFDAIAPSYSGPDRGVGVDASAGQFSGTYSLPATYDQFINITVKDSTNATSTGYNLSGQPYEIKTGAATLFIDSSKVGKIARGVPYQGTLTVTGTYTAPITWQVAPTATNPKTLLSGLTLQADAGTQGVNAVIAGTYTGIPHQVEDVYYIAGSGASVVVTTKQVHGFQIGDTVVISGCSTSGFNGSFTVTAVAADGTTFTVSNATVGTEFPTAATATDNTNLYKVRVVASDAQGNTAVALVSLDTTTDLQITTASLPNVTVGGSYSQQMTASGGVTTYTWAIDPTTPGYTNSTTLPNTGGLTINPSTGVISGTTGTSFSNVQQIFRVTDSCATPKNVARRSLTITSQASGLTITTPTPITITSGRAFTQTLQAAGSPNLPYTWSVVGGSLPSGISLNATTGVLSGTSFNTGFDQIVTFRVTDSINAHVDKPIEVKVIAGLALVTGVDYTDSTSTNSLGSIAKGQVDSITPRPNRSFYAVATGVISTSPAQITVTVGNPNVTAVVESISGGNAFIRLSGSAFAAGAIGSGNSLSVAVVDSGVNASGNFNWTVFDDGVMRIGGTLPTQYTTP